MRMLHNAAGPHASDCILQAVIGHERSSLYTREQASSRFLQKAFDGAIRDLVMTLLRSRKIKPEEIEALEEPEGRGNSRCAHLCLRQSRLG
jgi:hypothetical protein